MSRNQQAKVIQRLMSADDVEQALKDMASFICEQKSNPQDTLLLGVATRGVPMAERIADLLAEKCELNVKVGIIDATFYRDDFHFRNRFKNPTMQLDNLTESLDGKTIYLVDDVFYTGRSVRAALNAIMDLGRPAIVRFLTLIDRGQRELPFKPDFVAMQLKTREEEEVRVFLKPHDDRDEVELVKVEVK